MSVLIKNMEMPKGCIYANDNDQTEYCPLLNHDDVPFCQYIESEPEIAIGIGERPVYCPLSDAPEPCENTVSRQAAIDIAMQYCPDDDGSCSKAGVDIREMLDELEDMPSAQQWIPCSERLPKQGQEVICQCRASIIKVLKLDANGDWYQDANHCYMGGFVIAWMPLPEAYKGEQP